MKELVIKDKQVKSIIVAMVPNNVKTGMKGASFTQNMIRKHDIGHTNWFKLNVLHSNSKRYQTLRAIDLQPTWVSFLAKSCYQKWHLLYNQLLEFWGIYGPWSYIRARSCARKTMDGIDIGQHGCECIVAPLPQRWWLAVEKEQNNLALITKLCVISFQLGK